MGRTGSKPSTTNNELSIYKEHRPRAALRPVAALKPVAGLRLAVVPLFSTSAPECERDRVDDDERARCRLVSEPELRASSDSASSGAGSSNETRTFGGETSRCMSESIDARLLAILASGPGHGETLDAAFRRKEQMDRLKGILRRMFRGGRAAPAAGS